jgi:hypothetical protein
MKRTGDGNAIAKRRRNDAELAAEANAEGSSGQLARVNLNTFCQSSFGRGLDSPLLSLYLSFTVGY